MKLIHKEKNILDFSCYRNSVVRIDRQRRVSGLCGDLLSDDLKIYKPEFITVYLNDQFLELSDGYYSKLIFESPDASPIYKNLYNGVHKAGAPIHVGLASFSLDDSCPPFVATKDSEIKEWFRFDLHKGIYLDRHVHSQAMLGQCQYNFVWESRKDQYLKCFGPDERELWRIKFDGKFKFLLSEKKEGINKLLGEYGGVLWALLNSGKVLGIQYQTGEIVKTIGVSSEEVPQRLLDEWDPDGYIFGSDYLSLDRKAGEIRGLSNNSIYTIINLNKDSPERRLIDVKESMLEFGFEGLSRYYSDKDRIYFCGRKDQDRNLAVFDRHRQEVIWSDIKTPISPERGHTKKIVVRDNRLYLLDFNDDLYTFDLDSNGL